MQQLCASIYKYTMNWKSSITILILMHFRNCDQILEPKSLTLQPMLWTLLYGILLLRHHLPALPTHMSRYSCTFKLHLILPQFSTAILWCNKFWLNIIMKYVCQYLDHLLKCNTSFNIFACGKYQHLKLHLGRNSRQQKYVCEWYWRLFCPLSVTVSSMYPFMGLTSFTDLCFVFFLSFEKICVIIISCS